MSVDSPKPLKQPTIFVLFRNIKKREQMSCSRPKQSFTPGAVIDISSESDDDKDSDRTVKVVSPKTEDNLNDKSPGKREGSTENSPSKKLKPNENSLTNILKISLKKDDSPLALEETKTEQSRANWNYLKMFIDLLALVNSNKHSMKVLGKDGLVLMDKFLDMEENYQYFCLKMFTRQQKWYNVVKFCNSIHLPLEEAKIMEMYKFLEENAFIDCDHTQLTTVDLLDFLQLPDLKSIYNSFKLKRNVTNKAEMSKILLNHCRTQPTLSSKSVEEVLRKRIILKVGKCVKIKQEVYDVFYHIFLLATFTNPEFAELNDYFHNVQNLRVVFPEFEVEECAIFDSRDEFVSYAIARKCKNDMLKAIDKKDHELMFELAELAYKELQSMVEQNKVDQSRHLDKPYLKRFTAYSVYISVMTMVAQLLTTKYPRNVKKWLELAVEHGGHCYRIGEWYNRLVLIHIKYVEQADYEAAAKVLIQALEQKKDQICDKELHELGLQWRRMKKRKNLQLDDSYNEKLTILAPAFINPESFPNITIDSCTIRGEQTGRKRDYFMHDAFGDRQFMTVEQVALHHYMTNCGFSDGRHCEGGITLALFTLFFWDIIYNQRVSGTFVLHTQTVPLDMYSPFFYTNRKVVIEQRLQDIAENWPEDGLVNFAEILWETNSRIEALCNISMQIEDVTLVRPLVLSIGRVVWAGIFRRLVKNVRWYRSGMPDLLLWNAATKKGKFVEVKGENDRLSTGQCLWLQYLESIGADVEVCHVHSVGSKRRTRKKKQE